MTHDTAANDGNGEYVIKIYLHAGDEVKIRYGGDDGKGGYDFICDYTDGEGKLQKAPALANGKVERGTTNDNAIVIKADGYYMFYYKEYWDDNGLWVDYSETKPA